MKTALRWLGGALLVVLALVAAGVTWLAVRKPASRPPSTEKIELTPERIARGEYVVHHVSDCLGCHSDGLLVYSVPVKPGTEGQGGFVFDKNLGFPGQVAAQNITPDPEYGLGRWTDGEIMRAIREGVDRNGDALFPMMPYEHLREMSDDDVKAVVAFLRTLKPIKRGVPPKSIDFPVNLLVKFAPKPLDGPVSAPDRKDTIAYGRYLTKIGGCYECHTPHDDKNALLADRAFSGGWEMKGPWGRNFTANLTPAPGTYLARATREEFIARFKSFANFDPTTAPTPPPGQNTIMPWVAFSGMTEEDLGAIYDYLKTVKPIGGPINTFPDRKL